MLWEDNAMSATQKDVGEQLEELYLDLAREHLQPLWTQERDLVPWSPKPAAVPWLWRWKSLQALATRSGDLVTLDRGGDRRVIMMSNPGLGGKPFATPTLMGNIQFLGPHESAPAHRHSPDAIRFVLQGEGVWTTVEGDACDMHPGDLVLTPNWTWHDHSNDTDDPMIWFDGLDVPTALALDATFFELYPSDLQPQPTVHNRSTRTFGGRGLLPLGAADSSRNHSPLFIYRWADTEAALDAMLEEQGGPMVSLQFVDPTSGRPVLPTIGCEMHRIAPGGRSKPVRKVGNSVFVVYRGHGASVINGQRFDWGPGDSFVTPSWAVVDHEAKTAADVFAITDRPVLEALGLYREESLDEPQEIVSRFDR